MKRQLLCTLYLTLVATLCVAQDLNEVYRYVNEYRERNHRKPLLVDTALQHKAQVVAIRLLKEGKLVHKNYGQGEVLAMILDKEPSSPARVWAKSPPHNKEMLRKDYRYFGAGYVTDGEVWYYAMWFGF